ncbi:MAG: TM2 domain-containing protein, partial [Candidatus Heimdallarchaeota archaeon]
MSELYLKLKRIYKIFLGISIFLLIGGFVLFLISILLLNWSENSIVASICLGSIGLLVIIVFSILWRKLDTNMVAKEKPERKARKITQSKPSTQLNQRAVNEQPRSRLTAFLLCFFLGDFGAHRFYVGRTKSAVL